MLRLLLPRLLIHLSDKKSEKVKLKTEDARQLPESSSSDATPRNKRLPTEDLRLEAHVQKALKGNWPRGLCFQDLTSPAGVGDGRPLLCLAWEAPLQLGPPAPGSQGQ